MSNEASTKLSCTCRKPKNACAEKLLPMALNYCFELLRGAQETRKSSISWRTPGRAFSLTIVWMKRTVFDVLNNIFVFAYRKSGRLRSVQVDEKTVSRVIVYCIFVLMSYVCTMRGSNAAVHRCLEYQELRVVKQTPTLEEMKKKKNTSMSEWTGGEDLEKCWGNT